LRSYAKVREPIELSFGVVNGLGRGTGVLDGVHVGGDTLFPNYFGEDLFQLPISEQTFWVKFKSTSGFPTGMDPP